MTKIEHVKKLNVTPHWPLVRLAFNELQDAGLLSRINSNTLNYDIEAVVATSEDIPVGFLAFSVEKWNQTIDVQMAYVEPAFRRQGIHSLMFEKLIEYGKSIEAVRIDRSTHVRNIATQKAIEKQGCEHTFQSYSYYLADWAKPK